MRKVLNQARKLGAEQVEEPKLVKLARCVANACAEKALLPENVDEVYEAFLKAQGITEKQRSYAVQVSKLRTVAKAAVDFDFLSVINAASEYYSSTRFQRPKPKFRYRSLYTAVVMLAREQLDHGDTLTPRQVKAYLTKG